MNRLIFCLIMNIAFCCYADVNTDKAMSKIARDTKTYIVADSRAATEEEAYNMAFEKLSAQIADFLKTERKDDYGSDAVYLSRMSSIYDRLTSKISDNRYRVMLYVKKSDILPIGNSDNSILLERQSDGNYGVSSDTGLGEQTQEVILCPDDVLQEDILSTLMSARGKQQVVDAIQNLRKENKITSAAAFPMSRASDFYIIAISPDGSNAVLHFNGCQFINVATKLSVDISAYSNCTGYWFTVD